MNNVNISGNLAQDPKITELSGGTKVANFTLAVEGNPYKNSKDEWTKDVYFVELEAWDSGAERIGQLKKGRRLVVNGSLKTNVWEDKETGKKRSKVLVRCNEFYIAEVVKNPETSSVV